MFERFTRRARNVIRLANQEAQRLNQSYIDTEHILLSLIKDDTSVANNALKHLGIDHLKIWVEMERLVKSQVTVDRLMQPPGAKKVIEYAIEEARILKHDYVGTEHILLGLLREKEGIAAQVLSKLGLELEVVREVVLNLLKWWQRID